MASHNDACTTTDTWSADAKPVDNSSDLFEVYIMIYQTVLNGRGRGD